MNGTNHFHLAAIITAVVNTFLVIFAVKKAPKNPLSRRFACYGIAIVFWSFFLWLFSSVDVQQASYIFCQLLHVGAIFIPCFFLHFVLTYLNDSTKKQVMVLRCIYAASLLFLSLDIIFPRYFISEVVPKLEFSYFMNPGVLYPYWTALFFLIVIYAHILLFNGVRSALGQLREQRYVFLIGNFIGYFGGMGVFFPVYNVTLFPFPYGAYGVTLFSIVTVYAIFRFRFLDIEVIIRKTLVFAGLFSFAFGVFAFTTFLTQQVLSTYLSGTAGRVLPLAVSVLVIVLVYDPLRNFLVNLTDKFLFQKKYDYRKLLRDASAGISQIKSLHQLLSLVTHFVTMRIRVRNAAVLVYDQKNGYFKFAYSRGYRAEQIQPRRIFKEQDPLIDYLARERQPLDIERLKEYVETGGPKSKKVKVGRHYDFAAIKAVMEELKTACCVPSFLGERLRNVLLLGEKKSGDFYTDEDLSVLYTLAQESAIAIENARLYDQAVEKARELEAINQELNAAQTNLLRALDDTEVANKRLRDTHAQLIHEQKMATLGRLASSVGHEVNNPLTILSMNVSRAILRYRRDPELKVHDVLDMFQKMEQNISRIKAVVNTLTGLLKKSEHGKFEPLSLKLILEETLPLVQFQTYLENLSGTEVVFDVPANLPLIKGDLERLQEVFLNLFINAYHAMTGRHNRKITVTALEDPAHPGMVRIDFTDTGCGMSDEVLKKVFSYGFTTKPAGRGSGMGLYMCRYIVELHGGEVKLRSKLGEGTTFIITLPIYYERPTIETSESAGP